MLDHAKVSALSLGSKNITDINEKVLKGAQILLVEDGPDNQMLIAHVLRSNGAEVTIANNGSEAMEKVQLQSYDLVLMDLQMPVLDGYEATSQIQALGLRMPIIALTAHAMRGERERCLRLGFSDYVTKPFDVKNLIDTVAKYIAPNSSEIGQYGDLSKASMARLSKVFVQVLPQRTAAFEEALQKVDIPQIKYLAHQLAGSAGAYGFPTLGQLAHEIDEAIKQGVIGAPLFTMVQNFINQSRAALIPFTNIN